MSRPQEILSFWFGNDPADLLQKAEQWWKKDPVFDLLIKQSFEADLIQAVQGSLDEWRKSARDCLAYIILVDQYSRNIYRDTFQMFAQDPLALSASLEGQDRGLDQELSEVERWFFYMPMMHSEDLPVQQLSVQTFRRLANESSPDFKPSLENCHKFAVKHFEIIKRFGRFPHRNKILGRESTPVELEFLKQPGSSF